MKIVFLDFDGVLNSEHYLRQCGKQGLSLDPSRMSLLKQIVEKTEGKIVLTTSWREHWSKKERECDEIGHIMDEKFRKFQLEIFDKTPRLFSKREQEIEAWLALHGDVEGFVVLDDAFLSSEFLKGHFVKTANYRMGLDEENVAEAIRILKGTNIG